MASQRKCIALPRVMPLRVQDEKFRRWISDLTQLAVNANQFGKACHFLKKEAEIMLTLEVMYRKTQCKLQHASIKCIRRFFRRLILTVRYRSLKLALRKSAEFWKEQPGGLNQAINMIMESIYTQDAPMTRGEVTELILTQLFRTNDMELIMTVEFVPGSQTQIQIQMALDNSSPIQSLFRQEQAAAQVSANVFIFNWMRDIGSRCYEHEFGFDASAGPPGSLEMVARLDQLPPAAWKIPTVALLNMELQQELHIATRSVARISTMDKRLLEDRRKLRQFSASMQMVEAVR